jgi:hypothetical protein
MRLAVTKQMTAKVQAESLYFRHGKRALDILTHGIKAAITAHNDTLAMELDTVLQEVERLTDTSKMNGWSVYIPDSTDWVH